MCGIAGILRVWPSEQRALALSMPSWGAIPERWLDVLDESITRRGPDGQGRFRDRVLRADGCVVDVAFVHRRLSIIDHAGGHQPMLSLAKGMGIVTGTKRVVLGEGLGLYERDAKSELFGAHIDANASNSALSPKGGLQGGIAPLHSDPSGSSTPLASSSDRVCVIFNGCIYNHRELRAELQNAGHVFSTDHSDTEVLVHGWRQWGHQLRDRLDGMFACVIWDSRTGACVWMRDDFGEKPLACWPIECDHGTLRAFASSPGAIARLSATPSLRGPKLSSDGWLGGWIQYGWNQAGPWESWQLTSGATGDIAESTRSMTGTWHDVMNPTRQSLSVDQVDSTLRHAVHSRLNADVPVGCFLSGGIDSALITQYAREVRSDIRAYTVKMPVGSFDESNAAAVTARSIGVEHRVLECEPDPTSDLKALIEGLGLPFGDSSLLPMLWVSRAAKKEVSVALSGDGGDDLFLGYERQAALPWLGRLERLPAAALDSLAALASIAGRRGRRRDRASRLIDAARFGGYKDLVAIFPPPLNWELGLCKPGAVGSGPPYHYGITIKSSRQNDPDALMCALRFDRAFYLPEDLMRKADTASMAVALEVRAPFLEKNISRAAISAPISNLMPHAQRKGLLRQVARKYFPKEIVDRPKMGFAIPIGEWFRSDYGGLRTMLLDHLNSAEPFGPPSLGIDLNMAFVRQMLDEHLGTGPSGLVKRDHSQRLYMLLVLSIWAKWLGGLGGKREGPRG